MRNVKGHIPLDLLYNFILFILYSYHSINSIPPPFVSSKVFLVHLSSANIFALLSFSYRQTDRHTYKHKDTKTGRQAGRHTYKHQNTYKLTDVHVNVHMHTHANTHILRSKPIGRTFIIFVTTFY